MKQLAWSRPVISASINVSRLVRGCISPAPSTDARPTVCAQVIVEMSQYCNSQHLLSPSWCQKGSFGSECSSPNFPVALVHLWPRATQGAKCFQEYTIGLGSWQHSVTTLWERSLMDQAKIIPEPCLIQKSQFFRRLCWSRMFGKQS